MQFNSATLRASDGLTSGTAYGFVSDLDTGLYRVTTNTLGIATNATEVGRFDASATAGNTRFMLYDVDNATLERVTVDAADSCGTGFKCLRIPN